MALDPLQSTIAAIVPIAIKTGILFLVLMAPFKWEKELGALLDKAQTMTRGAVATAGGMAFGALPYVMKKKMDAGSAKVAGEDLTKMRHNSPAEYKTKMAGMKTTRAEQYVDDEIMKSNGLTTDEELKAMQNNDPTLYATEQNRIMGPGGIASIEKLLDDKIRADAVKSGQGIQDQTERNNYIERQIANVDHQDLKDKFAKEYKGSVIPLWEAVKIGGKTIIPGMTFKPAVTGNSAVDAASRAAMGATGKKLMNTLDFVQKYNPMGLASAWKERTELNAKNIEKSHYRSSKFTELTLGPEAALKHQMAIQKEDMGHIYTSDGMRGSAYWKSYQTAVKKLATNMGISMKEAGDHFRTDLRRMQEEQAPKTEYNTYLGNLVDANGAAAIIEGYDRASTIIAQEARAQKPRSLIQMQAQTAESSWHDVRPGPGEPPTPLESSLDTAAGQAAASPDFTAPSINTTYNFSNMTTNDFASLVNQRQHAEAEIKKNLTQRDVQPGDQQVIIQALRDNNGGPLPAAVVNEINKDQALKGLAGNFQAMRKAEIDAISSTTGGSDLLYRTMAETIAAKISTSDTLRNAVTTLRTGTVQAELDKAKQDIAKAIRQNPAMVDLHTVGLVERGLQIIETQ